MQENTRCTMEEATTTLARQKIRFVKKTAYQIKVGQFNFYPNKGTIYIDGQKEAQARKGLEEFIKLLRRARLAPEKPVVQNANELFTITLEKPPEDLEYAFDA